MKFIKQNILGVVNNLADTLNDIPVRHPWTEKLRCVVGLEQFIIIAKGSTRVALPQICACLMSAVQNHFLTSASLKTWGKLLSCIGENAAEQLLEPIFAMVLLLWKDIDNDLRRDARDLLSYVLQKYPEAVERQATKLPSFQAYPDLRDIRKTIERYCGHLSPREQLRLLFIRLQHQSIFVCVHALLDLKSFLLSHQDEVFQLFDIDEPDPLLGNILSVVLLIFQKFRETDKMVRDLAGECLGLIGAIDPYRVETLQKTKDVLVLNNFTSPTECINFTITFLEGQLVRSFRSANDTLSQSFLALAMQEFLRFCNFNAKVIEEDDVELSSSIEGRRWYSMSETSRDTLTPFLTSKYQLEIVRETPKRPASPIFPKTRDYREWLQYFTLDLLSKGNGDNAKKIFAICSKAVKGSDLSIANFVLPFAAMNVILGGDGEALQTISVELLDILQHASSVSAKSLLEKTRLACQVSMCET